METQVQSPEEVAAIIERGMALVRQINKESWMAAGVSGEEWERWQIEEDVLHKLLGKGLSMEEAEDYIEKSSPEEIERRHREMYPQKYVDSPA